jgi:plastocyanin
MTGRKLMAAAVLIASASVLGGQPAGADEAATVGNGNFTFSPASVTITAGEQVVWTQNDDFPHSVTADDGSFDSSPGCLGDQAKCMKSGSTFEHTFATAGTFKYYCVIHGGKGGAGMSGTITVTA